MQPLLRPGWRQVVVQWSNNSCKCVNNRVYSVVQLGPNPFFVSQRCRHSLPVTATVSQFLPCIVHIASSVSSIHKLIESLPHLSESMFKVNVLFNLLKKKKVKIYIFQRDNQHATFEFRYRTLGVNFSKNCVQYFSQICESH